MEKILERNMKYIYLVLCNPQPVVYSVFSNKKSALNYANILIEYRKDLAIKRNYEFGFYHKIYEDKRKENYFDKYEKTIFSACLKIKDLKLPDNSSQDGTYVKVIRKPLLN